MTAVLETVDREVLRRTWMVAFALLVFNLVQLATGTGSDLTAAVNAAGAAALLIMSGGHLGVSHLVRARVAG